MWPLPVIIIIKIIVAKPLQYMGHTYSCPTFKHFLLFLYSCNDCVFQTLRKNVMNVMTERGHTFYVALFWAKFLLVYKVVKVYFLNS